LLCEGTTVWVHKLVINNWAYANTLCTDLSYIRDADRAQQTSTFLFQHCDATDSQVAHHPHRVEHVVS
jgi:hypothetical protein